MADTLDLADLFPPADETAWKALVAKTLGETPFESLRLKTVEGLSIEPLYPAAAAEPLELAPRSVERPWEVRCFSAHPDAARANAEILEDLAGGAASVVLAIDPSGARGSAIGSSDGLARALQGVVLELAPVALDAGFLAPIAADWLGAAAKASPGARICPHMDPLSAFAEAGASPGPVESHLVSAATVAARLAQPYPAAGLFLASGRVVHEAGGGEAAELAFATSAALAYAKAMVRAGMPMDDAFNRITLSLAADNDHFLTIAKLRAARRLWARLTQACGVAGPARVEARSSRRMLAAQDAWTNMLRLTAANFGAAIGGADSVVLGNFTDAIGLPTAFARRQSRNTQLVLMEESHLGRVADPAAGSGFAEALTDELARAAWADFQAIEARGGIISALSDGHIAAGVAAANTARAAAGKPRIVGVTAFPPESSVAVDVESASPKPVTAPDSRLPGPDGRCPPLKSLRISEPFEARS